MSTRPRNAHGFFSFPSLSIPRDRKIHRGTGEIRARPSKRTVDLTSLLLLPRPALSRIPIDKARISGVVAIDGMQKNGHRVGVPSGSISPTRYYWVYIHSEREREREKEKARERSFPWFTLAGWNDASLPAILVQNRFQCVVPTVRLSNAAAALVEPSISCPRGDRYPLRS